MSIWSPQEGPQLWAMTCPADEIFFGGTRGGGKTDCALGRQLIGAEDYGPYWNGLMIRRKFKDFRELRRRIKELIIHYGLPAELSGGDQQTNYLRFFNGAVVILTAILRIEQADTFQGSQFTEITIDEAPGFSFIVDLIDKLKGALRSPHGVPCHMFLTGNPGGPGSAACKSLYIDNGHLVPVVDKVSGDTRIFIRSTLDDNKILCKNDPKYVNRLRSIRDPALRKAWLDGDWDVFIGQALPFSTKNHILEDPIWPIPPYAPLYMTFDWGWAKPFSVGWWWVDGDGRLYRFSEWYGMEEERPNHGLRLTDTEIAEGIIEREKKLGIFGKPITRLGGRDCFSRKPKPNGEGYGKPPVEVFQEVFEKEVVNGTQYNFMMYQGDDSDRIKKVRQFRERLYLPKNEEGVPVGLPMMLVYPGCKDFIRTIPTLQLDEHRFEDVDSDGEDHAYDEACHVVMNRPISEDYVEVSEMLHKKKKTEQFQKLDSMSQEASMEYSETIERIRIQQEEAEEIIVDARMTN